MKGIATFLLLMSSFTAFPESTKPAQTVDRIFVNGDVLPGAIILIRVRRKESRRPRNVPAARAGNCRQR